VSMAVLASAQEISLQSAFNETKRVLRRGTDHDKVIMYYDWQCYADAVPSSRDDPGKKGMWILLENRQNNSLNDSGGFGYSFGCDILRLVGELIDD
jgi:hypothetical protein